MISKPFDGIMETSHYAMTHIIPLYSQSAAPMMDI